MSRKSVMLKVILAGFIASEVILLARCTCFPRKYQEFDPPTERRHEEFRALPIEKQFDIYMYYMSCKHPPYTGFRNDIAVRGEEAIPFLRERLKEAESELNQTFIILIFTRMSVMRYADLRDNQDLLALLEEMVASMKNPSFRSLGEKELQHVREVNEELDWEDTIAARGEEAIPALTQRLGEAQSEWEQIWIIRLFTYMSLRRYGDLRDNQGLLTFLEEVVDSMKDPRYREMGESELRCIRKMNEKLDREDR